MQTSINIQEVMDRRQRRDFLNLPWSIYRNDPHWIPPLLLAVEQSLDTKKNPFYEHAQLKLWNAYVDGKIVGRIAGIVDDHHNRFHEEKTAFWGFFECIDDISVARALFDKVEQWAREKGMQIIRGPVSPSTNHECGLQITAFDTKPFIMMTQNPPYYSRLVEDCGHHKAKDLWAWLLDNSVTFDPRLIRHAQRLQDRAHIEVRSLNMKAFEKDLDIIIDIYNDAWERNWGFVPMNEKEFRHMARDMKSIIVPQLVYLVFVRGKPAAFSLWLPDVNTIMAKIPSGRLLPTGLLKLLWYTKIRPNTMGRGRILTLGVKKEFLHLGIAPLLYLKYYQEAPALGYPTAECSWILEDNGAMNKGLKDMKAVHYKTYRIYDKQI